MTLSQWRARMGRRNSEYAHRIRVASDVSMTQAVWEQTMAEPNMDGRSRPSPHNRGSKRNAVNATSRHPWEKR